MKNKVALIFGGEGYERKISERSAFSLLGFIDKNKFEVMPIGIAPDGKWYLYSGEYVKIRDGSWANDKEALSPIHPVLGGFLLNGKTVSPHVAVPALHGDYGEDGTIQGLLQLLHIKFVGEDVCASAIAIDKAYTKAVARALGIPTAESVILDTFDVDKAREAVKRNLSFPVFIKPRRLGSSFGASPANCEHCFAASYKHAKATARHIIAEELLNVDYEVECAFLSVGGSPRFTAGRVNSRGRFYSYAEKYGYEKENEHLQDAPFSNKVKITTDTEICPEIEKRIIEYSRLLQCYIGIEKISRFDFFVLPDKTIYFNEINTFPGMTETSLYPILTEKMGYGRGEFINLLISEAIADDRGV